VPQEVQVVKVKYLGELSSIYSVYLLHALIPQLFQTKGGFTLVVQTVYGKRSLPSYLPNIYSSDSNYMTNIFAVL